MEEHSFTGAWIRYIQDELRERWPYSKPEDLRLEIHPTIRYLVAQEPDVLRYAVLTPPSTTEQELLDRLFGVPVRISRELEPYSWRLVIVTEDVKDSGRLNVMGRDRLHPGNADAGDRGGQG